MTWKVVLKAFSQEQVFDAWMELRQYIEISCGIYGTDYGEPENLNSFAGRMEALKEIILGEEIDIGKQFSRIEDYADDWPMNTQFKLNELVQTLRSMLMFREENA
jgi:hypothetical protein